MRSAVKPKSAEQEVLDSLDELLAESDDALSVPMSSLNQAVAQLVENNAKVIKRTTERILRSADKELTRNDDKLNVTYTNLMGGLDAWLNDAHFLLTQLATKGGLAAIGAPLESALEKEMTEAPQLAYGATLVLAVKEAVPYFVELIEVLREIRDRMPAGVSRIVGEPRAKFPEKDEEPAELPEETELIDWPQV